MVISSSVLRVAAIVCFVVAALPHKMPIRFEWIGAALWVASSL